MEPIRRFHGGITWFFLTRFVWTSVTQSTGHGDEWKENK